MKAGSNGLSRGDTQHTDTTQIQNTQETPATLNERIQMTEPSYPIFARLYDPVVKPAERTVLAEHRSYLVDEISGTVLDLGAGTGAMFPYFGEATADGGDLTCSR